jgi:hypothetical protein
MTFVSFNESKVRLQGLVAKMNPAHKPSFMEAML